MIVMKASATEDQVQAVIERIESCGAKAHPSRGEEVTVIGAIGDREHVARLGLEGAPGVEQVVPILKPYKLASSQIRHGEPSVFEIGGRKVGGTNFALIAGPCTVESREQTLGTAHAVAAAGATLFRGGAYKPRTSPYAFHGLGVEGLKLLAEAKAETGLPIVTELMDARDLDAVLEVADVIQIGARNMQNYTLLTELGRAGRPVLLKRGFGATVDEWLQAAEYLLDGGAPGVILCERGIRSFEPGTRATLDVGGLALARLRTGLPVIADPSHAAGTRALVQPLALAALAAGADGLIVECHAEPGRARSDGPQALTLTDTAALGRALAKLAPALGRRAPRPNLCSNPCQPTSTTSAPQSSASPR
jgi:3-deoxy-7-phosphoheptulonate synthase